jgi:hypothetical protein
MHPVGWSWAGFFQPAITENFFSPARSRPGPIPARPEKCSGLGAAPRHGAHVASCNSADRTPGFGSALGCIRPVQARGLASSGTVARRIHSVTGDAAWCGQRTEARFPAVNLHTFQHRSMAGTHTRISSRGDGELRSMGFPRAPARRGRPHMQLNWPAAKSRARSGVHGPQRSYAHVASPCLLSATIWKPEAHHETARWRTNIPYKIVHGSTVGIHTRLIARRRRAQGYEWPRSSDLSRGGSSVARWPAHRQVKLLAARLNAAGPTQGSIQGGGK